MILTLIIVILQWNSRATFDNYVRDGFIPKGIKQEGFKELSWNKADLDIFLASKN